MLRAAIAVFLVMLTTGLYSDTPVWMLELSLLSRALSEIERTLLQRGQELNVREADLLQRESLYDDLRQSLTETRADLDAARKETRKLLWRNRLRWGTAGVILGVLGGLAVAL